MITPRSFGLLVVIKGIRIVIANSKICLIKGCYTLLVRISASIKTHEEVQVLRIYFAFEKVRFSKLVLIFIYLLSFTVPIDETKDGVND